MLAGWASTPRLGAFQTRRCCALFHAPHPRALKTSVIQGRLADDAPVFANPSAGVVDGLGSGLGVDAGGSGVGVGAGGSGVGVGAGGSGVTLGVGAGGVGSGVTLGVGTGVLGSGLGVGVLGSGFGVGAGGSGITLGVGAGVLGSGLGSGVGAGGSGFGVGAGGSGLGAGALGSGLGSGVGVGGGGVGGTHCLMEGSHSMQPFPSHVSASIEEAACDVSPKRDSVQISPMIVASNATLSGIRFLGLVAIALPFSGRWLM